MNEHYHTASMAVEKLRRLGFTVDFNVKDNCLAHPTGKVKAHDFIIVDVFRQEGNCELADEVAVYAIESYGGIQGTLVTGCGISSDSASAELLSELRDKE